VEPAEAWAWGRVAVKGAAKGAAKVVAGIGKVKKGKVADPSFLSLPKLFSGLFLKLQEGIKGHSVKLSAFLE
jgi:hypothetical protein